MKTMTAEERLAEVMETTRGDVALTLRCLESATTSALSIGGIEVAKSYAAAWALLQKLEDS